LPISRLKPLALLRKSFMIGGAVADRADGRSDEHRTVALHVRRGHRGRSTHAGQCECEEVTELATTKFRGRFLLRMI